MSNESECKREEHNKAGRGGGEEETERGSRKGRELSTPVHVC